MILDKVNKSSDVKNLSIEELKILSSEIRELIIKKVNITGGHFSPNLGVVELTIALHHVFEFPEDKIVFDVSHQCYPHKILTGRKDGFEKEENYSKYTGYTAPEESVYDLFKVGHTSTSVSLATGVAKARDLKGEKSNVIALIGDGSLTGGEAMEGLNNAADLKSNMIIVVNDNDMSIAENHGGVYGNLKLLRDTNGKAENNFFKSFGLDYCFVKNGNDISELIDMFNKVKDINHPIVVHVATDKGHGLKPAEENKELFHWVNPCILDNNNEINSDYFQQYEGYESITKEYICKKVQKDKTVVAITAATPGVFGFNKEYRDKLGENYTDVGIAEEHAVAYASALAKQGAKPIFSVMSSFVQRTYDQLSQDLCLNNSPITMLVYWGGISGADCTHLCVFDIPLISNIPNMVYLSPATKEEYLKMLDWSVNQNEHPVAIRVPSGEMVSSGVEDNTDYSVLNKYKVEKSGEKVAIFGLGNFMPLAKEVAEELKSRFGFDSTIINPKFITGLDEELLNDLVKKHNIVVTLENGVLDGGFGEKISRFYSATGMKVLNYGAKKEFTDKVPVEELYIRYRLRKDLIADDVKKIL